MGWRVLVTGSEGFVGTHLCKALAEAGHEVVGAGRNVGNTPNRIQCDVTELASVTNLFGQIDSPTHVVHLAAMTFLPDAEKDVEEVVLANAEATLYVAQSVVRSAPDAKLLFVSSCQAYGPPQSLPIGESHPLNPNHPYGESKKMAEGICSSMHREQGLKVVCARPFNHTGPGHRAEFSLPNFARQIARIEAGLDEAVIRVGNLSAKRDMLDVSDVVSAYLALLDRGEVGTVYNICRGESFSMQEMLDRMLAMSTSEIEVEIDSERLREVDIADLYGSHDRLTEATGWEPRQSLDEMLGGLLEHWRGQVAGGAST